MLGRFWKIVIASLVLLNLMIFMGNFSWTICSGDIPASSNINTRPPEEERSLGSAIVQDYFREAGRSLLRTSREREAARTPTIREYRKLLLRLNSSSSINAVELSEKFPGIKVLVRNQMCLYFMCISIFDMYTFLSTLYYLNSFFLYFFF